MSSLLGPFLVLSLATLALSQKYLIVPNSQSSCHPNPNAQCITLDQLAQDYVRGNHLTLIFQPGEHNLTRQFSIKNFINVRIIGQNATVVTLHEGRISMSKISQLSIAGLTFNTTIKSLTVVNSKSVVIEHVAFNGNISRALYISKADTVSIEKSTFTGNGGKIGGAVYIDSEDTTISNSIFINNTADSAGAIYVVGDIFITNSTLIGNTATSSGGGIYVFSSRNVSIYNSSITGNTATRYGGGIYVFSSSNVSIYNSSITGNTARYGGGIHAFLSSSASIYNSSITGNTATQYGGGIDVSSSSTVSIYNSSITGNTARYGGGICVSSSSNASIYNSSLTGNTATQYGGGICVSSSSNASIYNSSLTGNSATRYGGGIDVSSSSTVSIYNSSITGNTARYGGGIHVLSSSNASIYNSSITGNTATRYGGGIHVLSSSNASIYNSSITENTASNGSAIFLSHSQVYLMHGPTTMDSNNGTLAGVTEAANSTVYFNSELTISNNTATEYGGGIFLTESSLFVNSPATLSYNKASEGGAIYAYQSTIVFNNPGHGNRLKNNVAKNNGGGIYAVDSILKLSNAFVDIDSNVAAAKGGGFYLEQNSKLYIHKQKRDKLSDLKVSLTVSNNKALLGGGMYVNNSTSSGDACSYEGEECFIQTIRLYDDDIFSDGNTVNTFITHNTAAVSGSAIFGGLLDRCRINKLAELLDIQYPNGTYIYQGNTLNGLEYVRKTVELPTDKHSISSNPLQVRLCGGSTSNVSTTKGHPFRLNVNILDQTGNPVNGTIHSALTRKNGRLIERVEHRIGPECTELQLKYSNSLEKGSAQVELYANGPCTSLGISKLLIQVMFLGCTCPLGFHQSKSNIECSCECDSELQATECFPEEETFQPNNMLWIGATTDCHDKGYLVHDCPFDYCIDHPVNISLNSSQQIDRQCAYNRSGVLCGECQEGLSLVFGSSKCKQCSNYFLLILIPFAVAGIALVVLILFLNMTIATGTVYGLIFYANVLAANKAIFLPFRAPNFLTVFVSWVNLDLGIETCFYNGMDSQAQVLLQLAFPAYLFLLMFLIIILSKYINSFATLLSNRNPVAALCTLLILSYSKLLRLIIAALQYTHLDCLDNPIVWLYDGNVGYISPSHIPRFIAAAVILIGCVLFTTLLFFGQWFPRCSKWKVMKWTNNTKYIGFVDAFHAPFTPKHRYWPGLLLFVLIAHNLVASMAPDTSVPVLSAGCVTVGLIVYKSLMNRVYQHRLNSALETIFLLNTALLALGTLTAIIRTDNNGQIALAYVSMALAFILFVVMTCSHFYRYVLKKNNQVRPINPARRILQRNKNYQRLDDDVEIPAVVDIYSYAQGPRDETDLDRYITPPIIRPATRPDQLREPDLDILAPITEEDYRQAPHTSQVENRPRPMVTSTIVEIN